MITGIQVRMALAALRWSREELAKRVGLSRQTIQRVTDSDGAPERMAVANASVIRATLEAGGVEFIPDGVVYRPGRAGA